MMAALDRARMMAIADGLSTYVVFACKTPVDPQINADLWGRSYAIYEDGDNVSFIPAQKTPWIPLPKGMAFKVNETVTLPAGATNAHSALTSYLTQTPQAADPAFPLTNATGVGSAEIALLEIRQHGPRHRAGSRPGRRRTRRKNICGC